MTTIRLPARCDRTAVQAILADLAAAIGPHRLEIDERMSARGEALQAPDREQVRQALGRLHAEGIRDVAVCLLNSYANGEHEELVQAVAREHRPANGRRDLRPRGGERPASLALQLPLAIPGAPGHALDLGEPAADGDPATGGLIPRSGVRA